MGAFEVCLYSWKVSACLGQDAAFYVSDQVFSKNRKQKLRIVKNAMMCNNNWVKLVKFE